MSLPLVSCRPQGKLRRSIVLQLLSVACCALAPFALSGVWKVTRKLREEEGTAAKAAEKI
jgi:hypothetical protein